MKILAILLCLIATSAGAQSNQQALSQVGATHVRTAAEIAAGVTPTNYGYLPGNVLRYGADKTGVADSTAAGNACISVAAINGGVCLWESGTYTNSGTLTLKTNVTLSGYGATINYTGAGTAITTPATGAIITPAVAGFTLNTTGTALRLGSAYMGDFRDIRITGTASTTNLAVLLDTNTTGTVNPAGNLNTAFNLFQNVLIDSAVGTGLRCIGVVGTTVVTLNTFISFQMGLGAAVYGVEFNAACDNNKFEGMTRIALQSPASASGVGVIYNSGTPGSNVGVYANNFSHLAVDTFGSPAGDVRIGLKMNYTTQNRIDYFYQEPIAAGGSYVYTINSTNNYVYSVNNTITQLYGPLTVTAPTTPIQDAITANAVAGKNAGTFVAPNTAGQSNGIFAKAGTNASDYALLLNNAANTANLLIVRGDGGILTNGQIDKGAGTINAGGVYSAGTQLLPVLSGTSATITPGALVANTCNTATTTAVTGATTAMSVVATPVTYPGDMVSWPAWVSSANTISIKVCSTTAQTPVASAYNIRVLQ